MSHSPGNQPSDSQGHPRDRVVTVYGRKPVLEALDQPELLIEKVIIAHGLQGPIIKRITSAAKRRGIEVERANPQYVNRISRNANHDQGVVADIVAPRMAALEAWIRRPDPGPVFMLDNVTNPANVGMIIRAITASGAAGLVLPRVGCPEIGPLVIKASAGVAFRAPILRVEKAAQAAQLLSESGYVICGLRGEDAESLDTFQPPERAVYVLGNETEGIGPAVGKWVTRWVSIPMAGGVESLNVATAAAVVAFGVRARTTT